ncbi:Cysteine proteinase [Venustampulla echinocandica]|uniref:ubiquitinyl hydrolase 1 n=1 Tax=Venustampulla echinocandica TaxID=2656787 RepID=A0A370TDM2_9HELO|nr:Cysteine proteinase [Venustampulla echinocandica]RDL32521.1 Cysteine proteinase [Venustampulla echinocandica]
MSAVAIGKTAPRLIIDLLDYDPRFREQRPGKNLIADAAPRFLGACPPRKLPNECRHSLMKKDLRTVAPVSNDELPDSSTKYIVPTYCSACRYHFEITMDFTQWQDNHVPCRLSDQDNPLHHLQLAESIYAGAHPDRLVPTKYDPTIEIHKFVCSSETCPLQVTIKVSAPRFSRNLMTLLEPSKLIARGVKEIQAEPLRFEGLGPVSTLQALDYLRTYLRDTKAAGDTGPKRIAKRNKKFALAYSNECDALFEYLDFTTVQDGETEGDSPQFWLPPTITSMNRELINDFLAELDVLLEARPASEKHLAKVLIHTRPLPALKDIERSLGYFEYPTRSRTVNLEAEEHPYYLSLGAVDDFTDEFLSWAYDRQCQCDPPNKPYYLDCLEDLAKGRGSSDLETKVVMATSAGEYGLKAIEGAYRFFGLDPNTKEGDEHIMGVYKSRIESAPRQKEEAKNCLLAIAKARNSEKIQALANDRTMTFEEALEFLNISSDTASDSIEAAAVAMSLEADNSKVARALRVIANHRDGDYALERAAANMELDNVGSTLDIGEAYNRLQIGARNAPDETVLAYYQSLMNDAAPGSKDSYTEALRVIACDRQSHFLLTKLDDPNAVVHAAPSTASQPIGLDNIGNTCYLNSLLQYYYTVKPIRNVVIDFQNHRMELNDEDIKKKRVGGRTVAKSEIIKAQKFVDELQHLFENLKTASTRSIKPTRELAELTLFSSAAEANFRRASISSPSGPPPNLTSMFGDPPVYGPVYGPQLPPPPSQPPPILIEDDIEMVDHPEDKNDDDSSEATLVDMETLPNYEDVFIKDATVSSRPQKNETLDGDAIMVNGDDTAKDGKPVPEKQPPLPPRNKSGLVIQTNDKDVVSDDELWKFGSQQDVTEVIGNVNFRLLCALKPTSIDMSSGEQMDIVRDTLYGANAVYLQKAETPERKVEAWSNLIVFPAPVGSRDIYETLDVVFDEQIVEIDNTTAAQHASIAKLPPILHIQIQRTAFDPVKQIASKNRNPVIFPETIYLDRYMDSQEPDSALMRRRRETWRWKAQLKVLEARQAALKNTEAEMSVADALIATKDYINVLQEEEVDGISINSDLPDLLEERTAEIVEELGVINKEIAGLKQSLTEQFTDMRQYEYKLQAVFIHRGEAGGGHYWVYIYDFENDIWREYNDEYVTEVKDRRRIFDHQGGTGGTPYYLAYVRSSDTKDLVEAICREVPEVEMTGVTDTWAGDIEAGTVGEDDENVTVRHIEHARPRPLRPKPTQGFDTVGNWENTIGDNLDANGRPW